MDIGSPEHIFKLIMITWSLVGGAGRLISCAPSANPPANLPFFLKEEQDLHGCASNDNKIFTLPSNYSNTVNKSKFIQFDIKKKDKKETVWIGFKFP